MANLPLPTAAGAPASLSSQASSDGKSPTVKENKTMCPFSSLPLCSSKRAEHSAWIPWQILNLG